MIQPISPKITMVLCFLCSIHHVVQSFVPSTMAAHRNDKYNMQRRTKISFVAAAYHRQSYRSSLVLAALQDSSNSAAISLDFLDEWYTRSSDIKCPFFRRRAADMIDGMAMIGRFLLVRHKTLYTPPGCRAAAKQKDLVEKNLCLDQETLYSTVLQDWRTDTNKGYFVTGRLNSTIYRDDCFFDGPDPDMPVRGVRKFVNAISQLFDSRKSTAELLSLEWTESSSSSSSREDGDMNKSSNILVASWKLNGVLMLPWRPQIPSYTGRITYHFDDNGLVFFHQEEWDISVLEAFVSTISPSIGKRIWNSNDGSEDSRSTDA
mmetsp:Transcript_17882/g.24780  ORF Transcript_17882/g.24780 Transcript_17882/m.24780 type:complete len:319 (+) Transcript_17882:168-1124(+)